MESDSKADLEDRVRVACSPEVLLFVSAERSSKVITHSESDRIAWFALAHMRISANLFGDGVMNGL